MGERTVMTFVQRHLSFASSSLEANLIDGATEYQLTDASIVVNLSPSTLVVQGDAARAIAPWNSTILRNSTVEVRDRIAVLRIREPNGIAGECLSSWKKLGDVMENYPKSTPLYISAQDAVGMTQFDPGLFGQEQFSGPNNRRFEIRLNLWWCAANTNCGIHRIHNFLEIHTQVNGQGRMQKFRNENEDSLYEDLGLLPGASHGPFFTVSGREWAYPWHRYFGESECIWMAIEFHPLD
jgi:hypothetical protein